MTSDDAGQFNVGSHALCWVHAERLIHKLVGFNHRQRQACARTGRDCRDAFLGLMKTCDKLGVSFWDYLGSRLDIPGAPPILPLPDLIRQRAAA